MTQTRRMGPRSTRSTRRARAARTTNTVPDVIFSHTEPARRRLQPQAYAVCSGTSRSASYTNATTPSPSYRHLNAPGRPSRQLTYAATHTRTDRTAHRDPTSPACGRLKGHDRRAPRRNESIITPAKKPSPGCRSASTPMHPRIYVAHAGSRGRS